MQHSIWKSDNDLLLRIITLASLVIPANSDEANRALVSEGMPLPHSESLKLMWLARNFVHS